MDGVTTFLNADVESDIYVEQPQGFVVHSPGGDRLICHLHKALYGIREVPRAWNALLTSWLIACGFKQPLVDPGVFTIYYESLLYILGVYVDDSILAGTDGKFIYRFKMDISNRFKIEDLGHASWLLECSINCHPAAVEHMHLREAP